MKTSLTAIALVGVSAVVLAVVAWPRDGGPEKRAKAPAAGNLEPAAVPAMTASAAPGDRVVDGVELPPEFFRKLQPGERIPLTLPPGIESGLRCPDGSFLPLLNGVPYANPLARDPSYGPLPPVVAKAADAGGYEWYIHADGSTTTTRWIELTVNGQKKLDVQTAHANPVDDDLGLSPPTAGDQNPRNPGSGPSPNGR